MSLKPKLEGDHLVFRPFPGVELRVEIDTIFEHLDIDPEFQSLIDLYLMRRARRERKEEE